MKKTLKNVALCFCAAAISTFCYPQISTAAASADTFANQALENFDLDDRTRIVKPRVKKSVPDVSPAADSNTSENIENTEHTDKTDAATESKPATFTATAYALRGRTATGAGVRRGIIAADPRVLPLGTKVRLSAGNWSGTYTVADTGGAVKGRKIDVWVPNNSEARQFGRRKIMLTVLTRKKSN